MKILILNHNQEGVGTWYRCDNFARYLSEEHEITHVYASSKKFDPFLRFTQTGKFSRISLPRFAYGKFFSGQLIRLLITLFLVCFTRYDAVYSFAVAQPQVAWPTFLAKRLRGKIIFIDWDDLWGDGFGLEHGWFINQILKWHETSFLKYADFISCCSVDLVNRAKELQANKRVHGFTEIMHVPNGVNKKTIDVCDCPKEIEELKLRNVKVLISIGNTYTSSLNKLLNAVQELSTRGEKITLIMIGIAELSSVWKKKVQDSPVSWLLLKKFLPQQEMFNFLGNADALILPMDNNSVELARFPMRLGDYLLAQKPIVSNAVGDVRYYLEKYDAGFLTLVDNDDDFKNQIMLALTNSEEVIKKNRNSRMLLETDLNNTNIFKNLLTAVNKFGHQI